MRRGAAPVLSLNQIEPTKPNKPIEMEKNIELSKNLKLTHVDENNFRDGKLIAVVCYFEFFDEEGLAYVSTSKLDEAYPSYGMTEICSELAESFNDLLEDEDNWNKIVLAIKEYVKERELENAEQ